MFRFNREPNTTENDGHNGFVWSERVRFVLALAFALAVALVRFGPALADGYVGFGK